MPKKYSLPPFLVDKVGPASYERWLFRKAQAHVKRDRARGNQLALGASYRTAIHEAVVEGLHYILEPETRNPEPIIVR